MAVMTLPTGRNRPPVDPLDTFNKTEAEFRQRRQKALDRLADLSGQFQGLWDPKLTEADRDKRLAQIDRDRIAANRDLATADEALALAAERRTAAHRGSAELALAELDEQRRALWRTARDLADKLPSIVEALVNANTELRALADRDRELLARQGLEIKRGGLVRDVAQPISVGVGIWLLQGYEADITATDAALQTAAAYR